MPFAADSGATCTLLPMDLCTKANIQVNKYPYPSTAEGAVEGQKIELCGKALADITLVTSAGEVIIRDVPCEVTSDEMSEILIGNDLLKALGINVDQLLSDKAGTETSMNQEGPSIDPPMDFGETDEKEIREALDKMLANAIESGLPREQSDRWKALLNKYADVFRTRIGNDPPAKVPPMKVHWDTNTKPIRYKNRRFPLIHRQFMDHFCGKLERYGIITKTQTARFISPAYVVGKVPKPSDIEKDFRLTVDLREANAIAQDGQWPMPILEQVQEHLHGAKYFIGLDLKDGYFQCPLDISCQELYSFATHRATYRPSRVLQGSSGAVLYFQAIMQEIFKDLLYKELIVWLDDLLLYATTIDDLFNAFEKVLSICRQRGFKLNARKCQMFTTRIKWCGKIVTPTGIQVDPERIEGLTQLRRPETAADLMKFLFAANWIRTSLPEYAKVVAPLQDKLDQVLKGTKRTKIVARGKKLNWTYADDKAFEHAKSLIAQAVETSHPDPDAELVLMTDASDKAWSIVLAQIRNFDTSKPVTEQVLEPLYFLSGVFRGSARNWAINEKEAYPIIESLERLRHLLLRPKGFRLLCDHRNLVFLFSEQPGLKLPTRAKLMRWAFELQSYRYTIEHIEGEKNVWADILSRWTVPEVKAFRTVRRKRRRPKRPRESIENPIIRPMPEFRWPTMDDIQLSQMNHGPPEEEGWVKVAAVYQKVDSDQVWIPKNDKALQVRLLTAAHFGLGRHRGSDSTRRILESKCYWEDQDQNVNHFVRNCLPCRLSKNPATFKQPWGAHAHPMERNHVVHFDYVSIAPANSGDRYLLVLKDGFSHFCELIVTGEPCAAVVAEALLKWSARFGMPKKFFSDQGSHFRNSVMKELCRIAGIEHDFSTVYCAWSNGVVERINRDLRALLRILIMEFKIEEGDWPNLIPLVQSGLNHAPVASLGGHSPSHVFTALPMSDAFTAVFDSETEQFSSTAITAAELSEYLVTLMGRLERITTDVIEAKGKDRARNRRDIMELSKYELGDYVLYSQVDRKAHLPKLQCTWIGPLKIVDTKSDHVYVLEHLVTMKRFDAHVSRMDFYSDDKLNVTSDLKDYVSSQTDLVIEQIVSLTWNLEKKRYDFKVKWSGLADVENSFEPFIEFFKQVPILCMDFLLDYNETESNLVHDAVVKHRKMILNEIKKRKLSATKYTFFEKR